MKLKKILIATSLVIGILGLLRSLIGFLQLI